jgi:hypothetical protein
MMVPETLYMELEHLLVRLGVDLRIETVDEEAGSWGGLCRLYGKSLLILDPQLSLGERNRFILDILRLFDLEGIYIPPFIRETLGRIDQTPAGGSFIGQAPRSFETGRSDPGSTP